MIDFSVEIHVYISSACFNVMIMTILWRGTGGREARRIGAGGVREAGGEGVRSRIPKGAGDREKLRKILQHYRTFYNRNRTEVGTRMEEGGKREFKVRVAGVYDPPVSLHYICAFIMILLPSSPFSLLPQVSSFDCYQYSVTE